MSDVKDTDWAYAAGFVDGEGCIAISRSYVPKRNRFFYGVQVVVANRDRSVLDWLRELWGGWVVVNASTLRGANHRLAWNWRCPTGTGSEPFLLGIRPFLRIKGLQCDNALAMVQVLRKSRRTLGRNFLPVSWLEEQESLYWKQRELNHRGNLEFVQRAMPSPRKINRDRLSGA